MSCSLAAAEQQATSGCKAEALGKDSTRLDLLCPLSFAATVILFNARRFTTCDDK